MSWCSVGAVSVFRPNLHSRDYRCSVSGVLDPSGRPNSLATADSAPSSFSLLVLSSSKAVFLVAMPGAPKSVLAPSWYFCGIICWSKGRPQAGSERSTDHFTSKGLFAEGPQPHTLGAAGWE